MAPSSRLELHSFSFSYKKPARNMSSNPQNLLSSPSPTGVTGVVHNSSAGQGDEHERVEPHTITGGLHMGSHPPSNPTFSFHPSKQHDDVAGGSSAPPVSPEMWFLQEQERLKAEYMRRVQEHKQSAARTLSYDSTEPSSLLRTQSAEANRPTISSENPSGRSPTGDRSPAGP